MRRILAKLDRFFQSQWQVAALGCYGLQVFKEISLEKLKAHNANGHHILMQPDPVIEPWYMMADDLTPDHLEKQHKTCGHWKKGRMIIETSPGNYQVWIRCNHTLHNTEKRYWLRRLYSDPGADPWHRWGRCPGFFNRKEKHRTENGLFPLARLIWVDWLTQAVIPEISPVQINSCLIDKRLSQQDIHYSCHIRRCDYERGNDSATDFAYALALARRGIPEDQILNRIRRERTNWDHHTGLQRQSLYLNRTIQKALAIIHRL